MSARDHALVELDQRHLPGWRPGLLRGKAHAAPPPDPRDRRLAEQILVGTIKNLLHLRALIRHYANRPLKGIDPLVQKILSIGLYQLRFLDRIPTSAAVNEAVEQTRRFGRAGAAGFVNAVLRNATRQPDPPMPDPAADPGGYAELVLSHPKELYDRLAKLLSPADAVRFCQHDQLEPPTIVRLFEGAGHADLSAEGIDVRPHRQEGFFIVDPARPAVLADWAGRSIAQVQDPTAGLVIPKLQLKPGQAVLDRCAGVGTKTLQILHAVGANGLVLAMDPSEPRHRLLSELARQRGISNLIVRRAGMTDELPPADPRQFDRILVDAPCSNSGVLARRAEARYAQDEASLRSLAMLQDRILDDAAPALRPGGIMAYSTCSVWTEENQQRVRAFLGRYPGYQLVEEHATLPSFGDDPAEYRDGGFCAVLRYARA